MAIITARRPPVQTLVGRLAILCALGWIGGILIAGDGGPGPWPAIAVAVVVGGLSVRANGLIGRERARRSELQRDLQSAARIQRSLFPTSIPEIAGCEFAMVCRMSREIGGDCVDAIRVGDRTMALMVGDVSGKGIAAALVMSGVQSLFRALVNEGFPLASIARRIDEQLLEHGNGQYITAVMLVVDIDSGSVEYLSAGHVPFVVVTPDGGSLSVHSTGPPLGLLGGSIHPIKQLTFARGSMLIVVTDGVTERCQGTTEYGPERLLAAGSKMADASARQVVDDLLADNDAFAAGNAADDDLTIVALRLASVDG